MISKQYMVFERREVEGRKTPIVDVVSRSNHCVLGHIKWHAPWRQFCFFPASRTIFNTSCMKDIEDVISDLMTERAYDRDG